MSNKADTKLVKFLKNPAAVVGFIFTFGWLFIAVFAEWIAPFGSNDTFKAYAKPMSVVDGNLLIFGADQLGRDVFSRIIYGARIVVIWSTIAIAVSYSIGIILGVIAGYYRGWIDTVMSFIANSILAFPVLVLFVIVIVSMGGGSGVNIVVAVTFSSAPMTFRLVRAVVMDVKTQDFVQAAITRGESDISIMLKEILPNATGPLIVDACLRYGYTAIMIGTLGFLGLGLAPPTPDWGSMISQGKALAIAFPHLIIPPALAISTLVLGLNLLADGLREVSMKR
ncbi:MAG: ABC transporter permease [Alphaproteobacteria bacterium]